MPASAIPHVGPRPSMRPGRMRGLFLGLGALIAFAFPDPAHAQWTRIAHSPSWKPDRTWGYTYYSRASRLLSDGSGRLYLSQGDSLFIGENGGTVWWSPSISQVNHYYTLPLWADQHGLVQWGAMSSPDRGRTWTRRPGGTPVSLGYHQGALLAGLSYDRISRSTDSGQTWKHVYMGKTYGSIAGFAAFHNGWVFAAPSNGQLVASRDGISWKEAWFSVKGHALPAQSEGLVARAFAIENRAYAQTLWLIERRRDGKSVLARLDFPGGDPDTDSLELIEYKNAVLPDSAITALAISNPHGEAHPVFWLGTWGQGVWTSRDGGGTWEPSNPGLGDLHVEALCFGRDNWRGPILALTGDGLYERGWDATGMRPAKPASHRASARGPVPDRLRSAAGGRYRTDGRSVGP